MSKKFLSEAQVRRFQGLAGIPGIHQEEGLRDEEELPGDEGPGEELPPDLGDEFGGEEDIGVADLEVSDEGGEDLGLEPEQAQELAADIVRAVAQELEDALGLPEPIEVEVEDELGDVDMAMDMDLEEPPMGAPMGDEGELDLPPEGEEELAEKLGAPVTEKNVKLKEDDEEALDEAEDEELAEVVDEDAVVNEVLRRVVARLANK